LLEASLTMYTFFTTLGERLREQLEFWLVASTLLNASEGSLV